MIFLFSSSDDTTFFLRADDKKSETGIGTALDWTGFRESYPGGFSSICHAMACYVNYQSWDWIGIALEWMRYDTIQYIYVCINTYERMNE